MNKFNGNAKAFNVLLQSDLKNEKNAFEYEKEIGLKKSPLDNIQWTNNCLEDF